MQVIQDLADTGASFTGVTIAPNEVEQGNATLAQLGLQDRCRLVQADCRQMPFADSSVDCAYAIYALKYFEDLRPVLAEVRRVLKPGGRFVIYDLVKTDRFDEKNEAHR